MPESPDKAQVAEIEGRATEFARQAGAILTRHFGTSLSVEYKDKNSSDPVTNVDKEVQEFLFNAISEHYPEHGVIGEEDADEGDSVAPDWVWVLDPLDGTKNFLSGLPMFSSSIGVLHRGVPVVGALYVSWPNQSSGFVMHARTGGGAFLEDKRISVLQANEPHAGLLATLPGVFGAIYRFRKPMRGKTGDIRITGSIAFDLAMTAKGGLQYSITNAPRLWDAVGGVVLVREAGGAVMVGSRASRRWPLSPPRLSWEPLDSFTPEWQSGVTSLSELRHWSAPLVTGSPGVVRYVTENLASARSWRWRLARAMRRARRG